MLLLLHHPGIGKTCLVQVMSSELADIQEGVAPLSDPCCNALTSVTNINGSPTPSGLRVYKFLHLSCLYHFSCYGYFLYKKTSLALLSHSSGAALDTCSKTHFPKLGS